VLTALRRPIRLQPDDTLTARAPGRTRGLEWKDDEWIEKYLSLASRKRRPDEASQGGAGTERDE
jgi:hypothetical protein